jgi:hypothetical protein
LKQRFNIFGDKKMKNEFGKTDAGAGSYGVIEIVFIQEWC